jgi:hypothetical protein
MLGCNLGRREPSPARRQEARGGNLNGRTTKSTEPARRRTPSRRWKGEWVLAAAIPRGPVGANRRFSSPSSNMWFSEFTSERS